MPKKILIIEDNANTRTTLADILIENGYNVAEAADGKEGMEKVKEENPDLILLDIVIPKIDGYEFLKTIKSDELTKDIPVIIVTGKPKMEGLFVPEGIADYVTKPIDHKKLLEKIKNIL